MITGAHETEFIDTFDHSSFKEDDSESNSEDEQKHSKLLQSIDIRYHKRLPNLRSEPSANISEFNLSEVSKEKLKLSDLLTSLKASSNHVSLKKQLRAVTRRHRVLPVPLSKPQAERIKREVAYNKVNKEVAKWEAVVDSNRAAEHLEFPLKQPDLHLQSTEKFVKKFDLQTPLEREVAKILTGSEHTLSDDRNLTPAEEKALKAMSLEEAKERLAELRKARVLLSYKESHARRQNKIKSKGYHRILKRERLRKQLKEFEELKKSDPALAIDRLKEIDRQRIEERMTLKHRNTGKWAKQRMIRAKYDEKSREELMEQLELSRQLRKKAQVSSESEDEETGPEPEQETGQNQEEPTSLSFSLASYNPWMRSTPRDSLSVEMTKRVEDEKDVAQSDGAEAVCAGDPVSDAVTDEQRIQNQPGVSCEPDVITLGSSSDDSGCAIIDESIQAEDFLNDIQVINDTRKNYSGEEVRTKTAEGVHCKKQQCTRVGIKPKGTNSNAPKANSKQNTSSETSLETSAEQADNQKILTRNTTKKKCAFSKSVRISEKFSSDAKAIKNNSTSAAMDTNNKSCVSEKVSLEEAETENAADNLKRRESNKNVRRKDWASADVADSNVQIDPTRFVMVKTKTVKSIMPDLSEAGDEGIDDEEDDSYQMTIAEAFADDDVLDEFKAEKRKAVDEDKPKDIDLFLPGWGSWGGQGIKVSRHKRRRFVMKAQPAPPRKDHPLGNVIINEKKDQKVAEHQVSELPFPFRSVCEFENSIRQPLGNTWNPETMFRQLITPKVSTRSGAIIDPIDGDSLKRDKPGRHRKGKNQPAAFQSVGSGCWKVTDMTSLGRDQ